MSEMLKGVLSVSIVLVAFAVAFLVAGSALGFLLAVTYHAMKLFGVPLFVGGLALA